MRQLVIPALRARKRSLGHSSESGATVVYSLGRGLVNGRGWSGTIEVRFK